MHVDHLTKMHYELRNPSKKSRTERDFVAIVRASTFCFWLHADEALRLRKFHLLLKHMKRRGLITVKFYLMSLFFRETSYHADEGQSHKKHKRKYIPLNFDLRLKLGLHFNLVSLSTYFKFFY